MWPFPICILYSKFYDLVSNPQQTQSLLNHMSSVCSWFLNAFINSWQLSCFIDWLGLRHVKVVMTSGCNAPSLWASLQVLLRSEGGDALLVPLVVTPAALSSVLLSSDLMLEWLLNRDQLLGPVRRRCYCCYRIVEMAASFLENLLFFQFQVMVSWSMNPGQILEVGEREWELE